MHQDSTPSSVIVKEESTLDIDLVAPNSQLECSLRRFPKASQHIRSRGEETQAIKRGARFMARRWVVERTNSWMNRFRRILVRWEKKAENSWPC